MANILKVTQPTVGYENNVRNNPIVPGDTKIQNLVDPSRVVRSDARDEQGQKSFSYSYDSNFGNFLNTIKNSPGLMEVFSKFLFIDMEQIVSSGMGENFAEEVAKFMEMFQLSEGELLSFLKKQVATSARFQGVFFQVLHQIMDESQSVEMKKEILEFIKKYNDMASGQHLLDNIANNLDKIKQYMYVEDREQFQQLIDKLIKNPANGDTAENAAVLKNDIIPFLSKYISRTHDLGRIRDLITLLTLNTARYENGDKQGVEQSFLKVLNFNEFRAKLGGVDLDNIFAVLNRVEQESKEARAPWMQQLLEVIERGVKGEAGYENKVLFQDMMKAMLMNESVYMPLMHLMIPLNFDGALMFSELWIDPDAQEGSNNQGQDSGSTKRMKGLIKFDIKDVGFFDLIFQYQDGNVEIQLYYPERLVPMEKEIRNQISSIVAGNGLSMQNLLVEKCVKSKTITEVFPKIYERKNSVNVRV